MVVGVVGLMRVFLVFDIVDIVNLELVFLKWGFFDVIRRGS